MSIELFRISDTPSAKIGALVINGAPFCATLEDPWHDNQKSKSCIPVGHYILQRYISSKFGETFIVLDLEKRQVAGRSGILVHWGNLPEDTTGCVLLGQEFGEIGGEPAILDSKRAHRRFMAEMKGINECDFIVRDIRA